MMRAEWTAVFHLLHPEPEYLPTMLWSECQTDTAPFPHSMKSLWRDKKLLVASEQEDDEEFARVQADVLNRYNRTSILYLMLAQGCNFNCTYCPIPALSKKFGNTLMTPEIARAGINLWFEHLREFPPPPEGNYLILYGGEPLLNKPLIHEVIAATNEKQVFLEQAARPTIMVVTNGILLDESLITTFKKHDVLVAVGLDGFPDTNDLTRVDESGGGTAARIIPAIRSLVQAGIRTAVSMTITPANLARVPEIPAYFRSLGIQKFGFNFLRGRAALAYLAADELPDFYRACARALLANFKRDTDKQYEYQMAKKYEAFFQKKFFPVDCTCYGNQLVVQPNGQITNCPFFRNELGDVRTVGTSFRIWKTRAAEEWRGRLPLQQTPLPDIPALALSGGGCAWGMWERTGNFTAPDPADVLFDEIVFDEFIWSNFNAWKHPYGN